MLIQRSVSMKLVLLSLSALLSQSAMADDAAARQALDQAKTLFAARSASSLAEVDKAIALLSGAESQAQDKELKYDILVLESRALYFKGNHTAGNGDKKTIHKSGQEKADAADALGTGYSEAPYYAGVNLARWGEANGIVASLAQVPTLKKYMAKTADLETREGKDGDSVDGYGPHRTLGRMYKKLPAMFGGSHSNSVKELSAAVKGAPTVALNVVYLADSLIKDGNEAEKAEGRKLLGELLAKDPATLNPDRVPESIEEFQLGRDVLAGKEIN